MAKGIPIIAEFENFASIGKLKREAGAQSEINGLIVSGTARLHDASNDSLSFESRFDLAYNAAHAFSLAALRHHGYHSENRYKLIHQMCKTPRVLTAAMKHYDYPAPRRSSRLVTIK